MKVLDLPHTPKGTILSAGKRQIVAFLRTNEYATPEELREEFRALANAEGKGVPSWLNRHLHELKEAGHIEAERDAAGNVERWRLTRDQAATEQDPQPGVAGPRRVSMFGPTYQPAASNHRAGALDYARIPSLMMGRQQPFRGGR